MKKVAIVGGGLAGIISGIELRKKGVPVHLFERKIYPFHRVCGEYVSNEALSYLKRNNLFPADVQTNRLTQFQLTSVSGESATMPLDLGGFGISRYRFDHFLAEKAKSFGVDIHENTEVAGVSFEQDHFSVETTTSAMQFDLVIGSFGKRSKIDLQMKRAFTKKRSPYVGVKYHVKSKQPNGLISLHNFKDGYCGVSNIEDGVTNVCYLVHRKVLQHHGNIQEMERNVLWQNPWLEKLFNEADFYMNKPIVINEISFETKGAVENHILMAGDAAGMIVPLCGNGMAMAIHSGLMVGTLAASFCTGDISREVLEQQYASRWEKAFGGRLRFGRYVQQLFGSAFLSNVAVKMALHSKRASRLIMRNTHGEVF